MLKFDSCNFVEPNVVLGPDCRELLNSKIGSLNEGDQVIFEANYDFSETLIELVNSNYAESQLRAKMLQDGPETWIIKVKIPKMGEGCCGSCQ